ncbi:MAG: AAA family ATPase [Deferribacteraceae bacterium]|nr:AAA family ATPase [Deferribacteraceae bacterium]
MNKGKVPLADMPLHNMSDDTQGDPLPNGGGMLFAEFLRPKTLDDIVGQGHLFSKKAALRRLIESGTFDSLLFVGPPGTGKTTVARIAGDHLSMPFYPLHATTAGSAELKKINDLAVSSGHPVLVFIDEIHRYNKTQQNLLLKMIDDRSIKIIGASTENPTYTLMPAFRSRSFIFQFHKLAEGELRELAVKAEAAIKHKFDVNEVDYDDILTDLMNESGGDARRFLNMLEISAMLGRRSKGKLILSTDGLEELVKKRRFDDDEYYDLLSAMIKSIRGTAPDAALLWGLKLIQSGVAPEAVFRRLLISASEDVGNAYPDALVFVNSAYEAFMNVGLPEGMIILSQAITFLASCPKSNRSYLALHEVERYLEENDPEVPDNIKHAAVGYLYPHDHGGFVKQRYTRDDVKFYIPSENGMEAKIAERLARLWGA